MFELAYYHLDEMFKVAYYHLAWREMKVIALESWY